MKTKNTLKQLLLITIFGLSALFAGMTYEEVLFIPWGENDNEVKHVAYPGLHTGPQSFQVDGETITVFDTENKKLKTFKNNALLASELLEDIHILDFYRDGENLYLMHPQNIYIREDGMSRKIAELDDPKNMYNGFREINGGISISHKNGKLQCTPQSLNKGVAAEVKVTRSLPASVNIDIDGKMHSLYIPEVGSVEYLGSRLGNSHYIYIEKITNHAPLEVQRDIYLIDNEANILNVLHLPQQKYTYVFKEFIVGDEGELYHMHSTKEGIHILKWDVSSDDLHETNYPDKFTDKYHFNDFVMAEPELEDMPSMAKPAGAVTRAEALVTADEYVTHTWTATSSNIGVTTLVTTPDWIQIGQNQRIPYQWGGYSTIAQFDAGIAAGKLAGDITTGSTVDLNNSVGADCSGFVSICWTSGRYSTASFYIVSTELSSFNDLLPADATNKAGSHIRMVVEWTNDGRLTQIEETASGTPGWAARYYTWRLSDITTYVPIRYNNIQNSLAPRPTLLSVITKTDSVTLKWTADESANFTGYRIYGKNNSDEEYLVKAQVPRGVKTIDISQTSQDHYDYFVASYIASDSANYNASDVYSAKQVNINEKILIVDGFDRASGSYGFLVHDFVSTTAKAIDGWSIPYSSCANDAVITGDINLNDFDHVWWICGDESTVDETFNSTEQDKVEAYLIQGGKFFVSGSEIAWDLDNKGSTTDKAFIHDYLKASYASDDAGNYNVSGQSGTAFQFLAFSYSEDGSEEGTYAEDYPDVLNTSGGSEVLLKYGTDQTAAVGFRGTVPGGSTTANVMVMGFPFEVITTESGRYSLAGEILRYMGYDIRTDLEVEIPMSVQLKQNYPNPFNPMTAIEYKLTETSDVNIRIFDMRGREIQKITQGQQDAGQYKIIFNGTMLPSGMYVYGLEINGRIVEARKMILSK